jgi:hypothetical protein
MTQDQIIQMLKKVVAENQHYTTWTVSTPHLVELVNRAVKAEREACAKLCDKYNFGQAPMMIQQAIRARGEQA